MTLRFSKMHGAGNDFVLLDLRGGQRVPDAAVVQALGDRHRGVGFDQLLTIEPALTGDTLASYRIWNGDGSVAGQCGNGARCVAAWLHREGAPSQFALDSPAGRVEAEIGNDGGVAVSLGIPQFAAGDIPVHGVVDTRVVRLESPFGLLGFGLVSMGNPHAVMVVGDLAATQVGRIGPWLQSQAELFPEGVNVGFAEVNSREAIGLRVFERGAGETLACGSGACAAVAVLHRQGRVAREVQVRLPGGTLQIEWPADDMPMRMRGPAVFVFEGEWHG